MCLPVVYACVGVTLTERKCKHACFVRAETGTYARCAFHTCGVMSVSYPRLKWSDGCLRVLKSFPRILKERLVGSVAFS